MWGPSNISKICFRETQEFPRFLSPPIAGSSSAFLESEHLYSFYSWFPPLQLSPYLTPATTVKACLPLPPPPRILLLLNSMPETSHTVAYCCFLFILATSFCCRFPSSLLGRQSTGRNLVYSQLCAIGCSSQRKKRVSQTPSCRSLGVPWLHGPTLLQGGSFTTSCSYELILSCVSRPCPSPTSQAAVGS